MTTTLGILAAMPEELQGLLGMMQGVQRQTVGGRDYHAGTLHGRSCVAVLSRIGKVAAAATTVTLIREFGAGAVVCTGLAGGVAHGLQVGDVVVAAELVQHDMDARPLFPRFEVPLLGRSAFACDAGLTARLARAAREFMASGLAGAVPQAVREQFGIAEPAVHVGLIASGDRFVSDGAEAARLREALPGLLCVEMEGAAVAQVCHEFGVPCAVLRTVSDHADAHAGHDFPAFLGQVASVYPAGVLGCMPAA